MPELPEVETIRRQLAPEVEGRRIDSLEIFDERWTRPFEPEEVAAGVAGRTVVEVGRRGKYLLLRLDDGATLVMHLRMTGNFVARDGGASAGQRLYEAPGRMTLT